jgi:hypothetical protein
MRALLLTAALVLATTAGAAEPIPAGTPWSQPWFTRLDARFPGQGFHARWDVHRCACGDAWIEAEETVPEGVNTGELLLVDGRVLLVRGFAGRGEDLRAMVDSPMLMLQLLFVLLQKGEPGGPAAVSERRELKHADALYPLQLETGGAQGGFPAPWEVEGIAYRFGDGSHRFDLEFSFEMQVLGETPSVSEIHLSGILDYQPREFPLAADLDITGWQLIALRDDEAEHFAQAAPKTLAELREQVKALRLDP